MLQRRAASLRFAEVKGAHARVVCGPGAGPHHPVFQGSTHPRRTGDHSRVLARPAGLGLGFASLPRVTVGARCQYSLPPRRALLRVTPLLAIAHGQCWPLRIQRFRLDPNPRPLGCITPQHYHRFPPSLAFQPLSYPTSVHVSMNRDLIDRLHSGGCESQQCPYGC